MAARYNDDKVDNPPLDSSTASAGTPGPDAGAAHELEWTT
jgi:hypothetical protein